MNGGPYAALARLVHGGGDERLSGGEIVEGFIPERANDEPDLHQVRLARQLAANESARLLGGRRLDDRRIADVELGAGHRRHEGTGDGHAWRQGRAGGGVANLEVPERAADVDDRRDAAQQVAGEGPGQRRFQEGDLALVGAQLAQVDDVRTRVGAAGLEEVHVGVDEPRRHPLPAAVHDRDPLGQRDLRARADGLDPIAADQHDRVGDRGRGAVDDGGEAVGERGARNGGEHAGDGGEDGPQESSGHRSHLSGRRRARRLRSRPMSPAGAGTRSPGRSRRAASSARCRPSAWPCGWPACRWCRAGRS